MAKLSRREPRRSSRRHNARQNLRGEGSLSPADRDEVGDEVELRLTGREAAILHATLEDLLEGGAEKPELERAYRLLGWKALASKEDATGLTGRLASIAKDAETLEEFEAARDEELGPIIDRLESPENRDP